MYKVKHTISKEEEDMLLRFKGGEDFTKLIQYDYGIDLTIDEVELRDCLPANNICIYINGKWVGYLEPWLFKEG